MKQLFVVTFWMCFVGCNIGIAQKSDFEVESSAKLRKHPYGDFYLADFDLGELPAGKKGLIKLEIENPFDFDITYKEASLQCNCVSFNSSAKTFAANSKHKASVRLTTPLKQKSPIAYAEISLVRAGDEVELETKSLSIVNIRVKYRIGGLLAVKGRLVNLEIPNVVDAGEMKVPFVFTAPVRFENLELRRTESLRDVVFSFEPGKESHEGFVVAIALGHSVELSPISGQVTIVDKETGKEDGFYCTIQKTEAIKVAPNLLRFRPDPENEEILVSNAILKVNVLTKEKPKDPNSKKLHDVRAITVSGSYDGSGLKIKTTRLGNRTYKIRISLEKEKETKYPDGESDLLANLTIRDGAQIHKLKKRVYFSF